MKSKLQILAAFFLLFVACAWGLTRVNYEAIWNSTIDNTPIGLSSANSGAFTNLSSTSFFTQSLGVNSHLSSYVGDIAGYQAFNYEGTGDQDFIAANGGATPRMNFYYLLGGSLVKEMWLDNSAILNAPNGVIAPIFQGTLNGNASTATLATNATNATNATTAATTSGNSATATQFATAPTNCGTNGLSYGVGQNGNGLCSTRAVQGLVITSGICTTANGAGGTCSFSATWPVAFANASWAGTCVPAPASGTGSAPSLNLYMGSKAAQTFTITLQGGQGSSAGSNTTSEIDCTGIHQ